MECCNRLDQGWGQPKEAWSRGLLASLLLHALLVAGVVIFYQAGPATRRVVVPVEAITLVSPGPRGGGGGQPAPITQTQPVAPKPASRPQPKPKIKPIPRPQVKPEPLPEPTKAPTIATPAPPPAITRSAPSATASSRSGAPGATSGTSGSGQGGGPGSGPGVGPGQGLGSGSGSALQGYLHTIRQLLEKQKDYPRMARRRNMQGVVEVMFTIAAGGQIESAQISRSSGHDLLDEGARNTIKRVGRFPPFPAELNRQKLTIKIPLAFRLTQD
jgi:protein TonB